MSSVETNVDGEDGDSALIDTIARLARESSIEVTPRGADKIENFSELLGDSNSNGKRTRVFITFLPGSDIADTTKTAIRLAREGISAVPHIAARSLTSEKMLSDALKAWREEAGVEEVLLIGGAVSHPLGPFSSSHDVLSLGLLERSGIKRVGFAGHPEGSPDISAENCSAALSQKVSYAERNGIDCYIITQFCFELAPILKWLPSPPSPKTIIGLPGLATLKTLITHAHQCGIGNSMRLLLKRSKDVTQLVATNAPDNLLRSLAQELSKSKALADCSGGVHLYPLGGVRKTALWRKSVADRKFRLRKKGFEIEK